MTRFFIILTLFINFKAYSNINLKLDKVSGKIHTELKNSREDFYLELTINRHRPSGFDGRTFYAPSCLESGEKKLLIKIEKDNTFEIPALKLTNNFSNQFCLNVKVVNTKLKQIPSFNSRFSTTSEFKDKTQELFLERSYVDKESLIVKVPYNLTFREYAKEVLKGTPYFKSKKHTWEFEVHHGYITSDSYASRKQPRTSYFNTGKCYNNSFSNKCIASKTYRADTTSSLMLSSTLDNLGKDIFHLSFEKVGPLRDFEYMQYSLKLNVWNLKTKQREAYVHLNPSLSPSQNQNGYIGFPFITYVPSKSLIEYKVELNDELEQLNRSLKSY